MMNVKQLRAALVGLADDMPVVNPSQDHNYAHVELARPVEAHDQQDPSDPFGEYGGKDCEADYGPKVEVFCIE